LEAGEDRIVRRDGVAERRRGHAQAEGQAPVTGRTGALVARDRPLEALRGTLEEGAGVVDLLESGREPEEDAAVVDVGAGACRVEAERLLEMGAVATRVEHGEAELLLELRDLLLGARRVVETAGEPRGPERRD